MPCGKQILDGEPHGSVITSFGYRQGHKRCADAFYQRKQDKERKERHEAMVKRVDQPQAGGAIDWSTQRDAIMGSTPLEKSPGKPDLSEALGAASALPPEGVGMGGVIPISSVPMEESPPPPLAPNPPVGGMGVDREIKSGDVEFTPGNYPRMAVTFIPYNSRPPLEQRPDPALHVQTDGWLFIETGNVRIAIPDREEWDKLVHMGNALWDVWEQSRHVH